MPLLSIIHFVKVYLKLIVLMCFSVYLTAISDKNKYIDSMKISLDETFRTKISQLVNIACQVTSKEIVQNSQKGSNSS